MTDGIGALATYMVLCIYGGISGRVLAFAVAGFSGGYIENSMPEVYGSHFLAFLWQTLFMAVTVAIFLRGLHKGIQSFSRIAMPTFFVILLILAIYSLNLDGAGDALDYLLTL